MVVLGETMRFVPGVLQKLEPRLLRASRIGSLRAWT